MEVQEILKKLVSYNTIKDKENKEIVDYLENQLKEIGFSTLKKGKNLVMQYGKKPKLGFIGHTDTVEYIEGWKTNPFVLTKKGSKIYGLGSCDMKSGIAAFIQTLKEIDLKNLNYGIKVFFTYSEEKNFDGVRELLQQKETFPEYLIIGEPTNNEIVTGCKGLLVYKFIFNGIKVHSSNPDKGKSANSNCVNFLVELEEFYKRKIKPEKNEKYLIDYTTMNIGLINGGSAPNSVSAKCEATVDFRIARNKHIEKIKSKVEELKSKYDMKVEIIQEINEWYNDIEFINEKNTANFCTEASFVKGKRMIIGTGPITAHEIDEHIEIESLEKLVKQYKEIIEKIK